MRRFTTFAPSMAALVALAACSSSERAGQGEPGPSPAVSITSPEFEVHGSGPVVIQVVVVGCMPNTVQLLADDEPLAVLVPPFQYTWDTTWALEGRREITARAECAGQAGTSPPAVIFVDRTRPVVLDRTPQPASATAWVRDPIAVTFSEPVDLESAREAIVLRDGTGNTVAATVVASEGGARLTLVPAVTPVANASFTVEIGGAVRDLAGYSLARPESWTFTYPVLFQRGPLSSVDSSWATEPDLAVDASGNPIAVWRPCYSLSLFEFTGDGAVRETRAAVPYGLYVGIGALGADVYIVDGSSTGSGFRTGFLRPGDGTFSYGPAVTDGTTQAFSQDVTFAPDGTPLVAWEEYGGAPWIARVRAAFLDGGVWNDRGTTSLNLDPDASAFAPSVARDSQGRPAIAFYENERVYVKRWEETGWASVGPGLIVAGGDSSPALAFDGDEPYVVVRQSWHDLRVYRLADGAWTPLAGDPMRDPLAQVSAAAIAVPGPGRVVLAWTEGIVAGSPYTAGSLYVSEWDGSAWMPRGGALNRGADYPAYAPALALEPDGSPIVLWTEPVAPFTENAMWNLRLARANR